VFAASLKQDLPIFEGQQGTGKDMVKHYADFSGILSPLKLTIKELIYTPRSAWLLVLNNGITVRLGRENEIKRLQQFVQIWPSLLRKKQSRIEYVDMRYKDGFSVRYRPSENPARADRNSRNQSQTCPKYPCGAATGPSPCPACQNRSTRNEGRIQTRTSTRSQAGSA